MNTKGRSWLWAPIWLVMMFVFGLIKQGLMRGVMLDWMRQGFSWQLVLGALLMGVAVWGYYTWLQKAAVAGASLFSKEGKALLSEDQRKPIVYLRSFRDDEQDKVFHSREWVLKTMTAATGPLIAVGDPRERFQTPGAARMYVGEEWREEVVKLIANAQAVIIRPGVTKGVRWELAEVRRLARPEQVFLFMPLIEKKARQAAWEEFRQVEEIAAVKVPAVLPDDTTFLRFDQDWNALPVDGGKPPWIIRFFSAIGLAYDYPYYYLPLLTEPASRIFRPPMAMGVAMAKIFPIYTYLTLLVMLVGFGFMADAIGAARPKVREPETVVERRIEEPEVKIDHRRYVTMNGESRATIAAKFDTIPSLVRNIDPATGDAFVEDDSAEHAPLAEGTTVDVLVIHVR